MKTPKFNNDVNTSDQWAVRISYACRGPIFVLQRKALGVAIYVLIVGIICFSASQAMSQNLQAELVYSWDFQMSSDTNFDQKPDGWKRRQDGRHPAYIDIRIQPRSPDLTLVALEAQATLTRWVKAWKQGKWNSSFIAESTDPSVAEFLDRTVMDKCLDVTMDGGAAELIGPIFPMESRFSYSLRAEMSCDDLNGHTAWIELHLLDDAEKLIDVLSTQPFGGTQAWQSISTQISTIPGSNLKWGRIHLKVEPHDAMVLEGRARFDSIHIYRMPRLTLATKLPFSIARPGESFQVQCEAKGIQGESLSLLFELRDHEGRKLKDESVKLIPTSAEDSPRQKPDDLLQRTKRPYYVKHRATRSVSDGLAIWELRLDEPGLYRIRVNLGRGAGQSQHREIMVGVMADSEVREGGPFGWSLPELGRKLDPDEVPEMVRRFGAGWVKIPIWFDVDDKVYADKLVGLADRLQLLGTQVVGCLDQPPPSQRESFGEPSERLYAVNLFRDVNEWGPFLEPVLNRMGMKLTWFQLGADDDNSFMGNKNIIELVAALRGRMQTYSQELKLAIAWTWLDVVPQTANPAWNALHFSTSPQLSASELESHVETNQSQADIWVSLNPLDGSRYRLLDRVRDLTERMVAVKKTHVPAAFVTDPLNPEWQLFTKKRTVGELLIPWHTLVSNLGGAVYAGTIELPGGSVNHIFEQNGQGVMLLWKDTPTTEQTFFGENIKVTDIWGRDRPFTRLESKRGTLEQSLQVDSWPLVVRGIDMNLVRFHQSFEVTIEHLSNPSILTQQVPLRFENTWPHSMSGKLSIISPSLLKGQRSEMPVQLRPSGSHETDMVVTIRSDASAGQHKLRFDLDVFTDKPYHFSLYRSIKLGLGDIELVWETNRLDAATLELRVEVRNNTESSASFDCKLFPPGRAYERFRIEEAKPGITVREIRLEVPEQATDVEAWLRCEQFVSGRILNYRVRL